MRPARLPNCCERSPALRADEERVFVAPGGHLQGRCAWLRTVLRVVRAGAAVDLAAAGGADPLLAAPLERALLNACDRHPDADARRRQESQDLWVDSGHCSPLVAVRRLLKRRRACGCAWKYNSRRRESDTCV